MTKQELIKKMRSLLPDNRWVRSDFKIDQNTIEKMDESDLKLIWLVRPQGTDMQRLDRKYIEALLAAESTRLQLMRDNNYPIKFMLNYNYEASGALYSCDGKTLHEIDSIQAVMGYEEAFGADIQNLKYQYPFEYLMRDQSIELVFSDEAKKKLTDTMGKAAELNDSSLLDCLDRLRCWSRCAVDHKVEIHTDFAPYSFGFCEKVNGQARICGGIIYHKGLPERKWCIHT